MGDYIDARDLPIKPLDADACYSAKSYFLELAKGQHGQPGPTHPRGPAETWSAQTLYALWNNSLGHALGVTHRFCHVFAAWRN